MQDYTHSCKACGKKYKACNACNEIKSFETWRSVACSMECYQLWMTLIEFNCGRITAENAKEYIDSLDLEGKELNEDIKIVMKRIDKVIAESKKEEKSVVEPVVTYRSKKNKKRNSW